MTTPQFIKPRQQFSALALAASVTLGMLLSVNMLATQHVSDAQMAAAASAPQAAVQRADTRV